jgi:hypothetical protein
MLDPAPKLFDREDIVLHGFAVLLLIFLLELRPQSSHHKITRDLWRDQANLFFKLGLADHLAVAELFHKILSEMLTVVGKQIVSLVGGDKAFAWTLSAYM